MAGCVQIPRWGVLRDLGDPLLPWLYRIPMPIFSTGLVQTPELAGFRSIVHTFLFLTFFYLGFIRKWRGRSTY
jgi:hypothetical protein